tara:strand:+ start:448 stop:957 length:510 start_codon:yes stop_codon:yes gene_type:complete
MKYFDSFPEVVYNNYTTKNIISKVKLSDILSEDLFSYANYTMSPNDKPWTIAHDYYEDVDRTWLVFLSNNIVDPYYEWHLDQFNFEKYIIKKYGSLEAATTNIEYYTNTDGIKYSKDTYTYADVSVRNTLTPVYSYNREDDDNEAKRVIRLLRYDLAGAAEENLKRLLK